MVGVFVHWVYGPHTTDGVVGKDNPLLLASQLLRPLAGPGRAAQHRRVPREPGPRALAHLDRRARLDDRPGVSWSGSTSGARPAGSPTPSEAIAYHAPVSRAAAGAARAKWPPRSARRPLADPDAGRHLDGHDQRLLRPAAARRRSASPSTRSTRRGSSTAGAASTTSASTTRSRSSATRASRSTGVRAAPTTSTSRRRREQLRDYLAVARHGRRVQGRCLGWQYQLGLIPLRPPSATSPKGCSTRPAAPNRTATRSPAPPRPTRATSCRWR